MGDAATTPTPPPTHHTYTSSHLPLQTRAHYPLLSTAQTTQLPFLFPCTVCCATCPCDVHAAGGGLKRASVTTSSWGWGLQANRGRFWAWGLHSPDIRFRASYIKHQALSPGFFCITQPIPHAMATGTWDLAPTPTGSSSSTRGAK
jgi:hypothetical protein